MSYYQTVIYNKIVMFSETLVDPANKYYDIAKPKEDKEGLRQDTRGVQKYIPMVNEKEECYRKGIQATDEE